jgi:hypothetical protein
MSYEIAWYRNENIIYMKASAEISEKKAREADARQKV